MKQQIVYNLEEFATNYHLKDIFGAYAAHFSVSGGDSDSTFDSVAADSADGLFRSMVRERALFAKLLLVKQGHCTIKLQIKGDEESISLSPKNLLVVTAKEVGEIVEVSEDFEAEVILVVAVTNSPKHDFSRCKSVIYKFLSRDTKSARDKNGTKPRKNKVKNTLPEISLMEYLCFVCKGTNLFLEKRGEIPISLIHNSFSTIVPQMWLLQAILTSNGLVCENRVLNFVLHSDGHFQKRELAIEPKICHPYCPILGLVNV